MNFAVWLQHIALETDMRKTHFNQVELADRWKISPRTLERWRWMGDGPTYLKIGGRVVYRIEDIEAFEAEQQRSSTAQVPAKAGVR